MDQENKTEIKEVAIYIRKSRVEETEDDLKNHINMLIDICKKYHWNYTLYREVKSGATIEMRPEMQRLLKDIESELFDALLLVDQDRLGRGDSSDSDYIKRILKKTHTYLCIGEKVMNLHNDNDDTLYEFNAFFAKLEYKMITKRLKRGKVLGARRGKWTNGTPPFPYIYNRIEKRLEIHEGRLKLYNEILEMFLERNMATNQIASELNKRPEASARTAKGNYWSGKTIYGLLLDETHLGKIVRNRSTSDAHKNKSSNTADFKKLDRKDWEVYEGEHQAVKTQEQHDRILIKLSESLIVPRISTARRILPLTGLIVCGLCGSNIAINVRDERNGILHLRKCHHKDPFGTKCKNMSGPLLPILHEINQELLKYEKELNNGINHADEIRKQEISQALDDVQNLIHLKENALYRIDDAYESGIYSKEKYKARMRKTENDLYQAREQKRLLQVELSMLTEKDTTKKLQELMDFSEQIQDKENTYEYQNELYKTIIKSIVYTRTEYETIDIKINFK